MRNWISIDGHYSSEFGLKMARLPLWTTAAETVENTALPGVPVEAGRHTGQYKDFDLTLTGYITRYPFDLPSLNAWIQGGKKLVMGTQPQIYGIIRKVGQITPKRIGTRANEIQIPLTFQPFKYTNTNLPPYEYDTSPAYFRLWGNIYSEPLYRLTLTGDAAFTVNGVTLTLTELTGDVIVDLPRRKIYQESGGVLTVVQDHTAGAFWDMVLHPGVNAMSWEGISRVVLTPNERWL